MLCTNQTWKSKGQWRSPPKSNSLSQALPLLVSASSPFFLASSLFHASTLLYLPSSLNSSHLIFIFVCRLEAELRAQDNTVRLKEGAISQLTKEKNQVTERALQFEAEVSSLKDRLRVHHLCHFISHVAISSPPPHTHRCMKMRRRVLLLPNPKLKPSCANSNASSDLRNQPTNSS